MEGATLAAISILGLLLDNPIHAPAVFVGLMCLLVYVFRLKKTGANFKLEVMVGLFLWTYTFVGGALMCAGTFSAEAKRILEESGGMDYYTFIGGAVLIYVSYRGIRSIVFAGGNSRRRQNDFADNHDSHRKDE